MKTFYFTIEQTNIGKGYVSAENIEEAKMKINNGDYDDIYDEVDTQQGEIIDIQEG